MKTYQYTIVGPSGSVQRMRVPQFWSPDDVEERLPHFMIFFHVPARYKTWDDGSGVLVVGPAILLQANKLRFKVDHAPVDDRDACALLLSTESARNAVVRS